MLNSIFNRFAKKHKFLNFDDFVYCMASLKLAVSKLHHVTLCVIVTCVPLLFEFVSGNYQSMKDLGEMDMPYEKVILIVYSPAV